MFNIPFNSYAMVPVFDSAVYLQTMQNYIQLVAQLAQLEQQAAYLKRSLNAIKTLGAGDYHWSDVSHQIDQLGNVIQETKGISYNSENLNTQFQKAYSGYKAPQDFNAQYQQNMDTTLNTINGSLQSFNMSALDFANEPKRLSFLESQVQNAPGQTQAIQASAEISSEVVSQLQLLRQTIMSASNAQNVYYANQLQNEASNSAGLKSMLEHTDAKPQRYGASGNTIHIPHF